MPLALALFIFRCLRGAIESPRLAEMTLTAIPFDASEVRLRDLLRAVKSAEELAFDASEVRLREGGIDNHTAARLSFDASEVRLRAGVGRPRRLRDDALSMPQRCD